MTERSCSGFMDLARTSKGIFWRNGEASVYRLRAVVIRMNPTCAVGQLIKQTRNMS